MHVYMYVAMRAGMVGLGASVGILSLGGVPAVCICVIEKSCSLARDAHIVYILLNTY